MSQHKETDGWNHLVIIGCCSDGVYKNITLSNMSTNRPTGLISVSIFRLVHDVMQARGGMHVCGF